MDDLADSLAGMGFVQLSLLFAFVIGYMLSLGGLLGTRARWRAAVLTLGLGAGFAALTEPWVHGALLIAFVVAGLGLFVLAAWLLARLFGPREQTDELGTEAATTSQPVPLEPVGPAAVGRAPLALKLSPRRARSRS